MADQTKCSDPYVPDIMKEIQKCSVDEIEGALGQFDDEQAKKRDDHKVRCHFLQIVNRTTFEEDFPRYLITAESTKLVSSYWQLEGRFIFLKKVIRRLIAFEVEPIADSQNHYNDAVYAMMQSLAECAERQDKYIRHLEARLEQLEDKNGL